MPEYASSGSGRPIPSKIYKEAILSLAHTINFIDNCIQCFEVNYDNRLAIYKRKMSEYSKQPQNYFLQNILMIIKQNHIKRSRHYVGNGLRTR